MPKITVDSEKKQPKKKTAKANEVVSAYSEEGQRRNAKLAKQRHITQILVIAVIILILVGGIVFSIVAGNANWFQN